MNVMGVSDNPPPEVRLAPAVVTPTHFLAPAGYTDHCTSTSTDQPPLPNKINKGNSSDTYRQLLLLPDGVLEQLDLCSLTAVLVNQ